MWQIQNQMGFGLVMTRIAGHLQIAFTDWGLRACVCLSVLEPKPAYRLHQIFRPSLGPRYRRGLRHGASPGLSADKHRFCNKRQPANQYISKRAIYESLEYEELCRKLEAFGCDQILLTDRGTFFGYNMLINDMRSFPIMAETGYPVYMIPPFHPIAYIYGQYFRWST